jgi:hypothetical protein
MNIEDSSLYLLRIDFSSFIISGYKLLEMFEVMKKHKVVEVWDIANNYFMQPLKEDTRVSYQKLYNIKSIELN